MSLLDEMNHTVEALHRSIFGDTACVYGAKLVCHGDTMHYGYFETEEQAAEVLGHAIDEMKLSGSLGPLADEEVKPIIETVPVYTANKADVIKNVDQLKADDPVNHPSHYTTGKIECIDFITDKNLNFCRGNAVKYIVRAGLKDPNKEIEDLEKAIFYINKEIQTIKERKGET